MTVDADAVGSRDHPSPHRHRVSLSALLFGLFGGPVAWIAQLIVNYGLASYACFPGDTPRSHVPPGWDKVWLANLVINLLAIVVALVASEVSRRSWHATSGEHPGSSEHLLEAGEGRTRFLAMGGWLAGLGFALAIVFDTVALLAVPLCPG